MGKALIVGILALLFAVLLACFVYILFKFIRTTDNVHLKTKTSKSDEFDIDQLLKLVADQNLSKNDLKLLVGKFSELTIPPKVDGVVPKEADVYLNFILQVCSHKNTDAKIITALSSQAKRKNLDYKDQIDAVENAGIAKFSKSKI